MDHKSFLNKVRDASGLDSRACENLMSSFIEVMQERLSAGDTISIPSFGSFEPKKRNERIMSHPSTPGKKLLVPPKVVVSFKSSAILKNRINKLEDE